MKLALCVLTLNRLAELKVLIARMRGSVDRMLIVDGGSIDDTIYYVRNQPDCDLILAPWRDDFCWSRNQYVERAKKDGYDWILVADTDELFSLETARAMRSLVAMYEDMKDIHCVAFRDEAVTLRGDVEVYRANNRDDPSAFYKPLLAKVTKDLHYRGNPHHGFWWGDSTKPVIRAPKQFCYSHVKQVGCIAERGFRNFWIGGGGDNERVPKWRELRAMANEILERERWRCHAGEHGVFDPSCSTCTSLVPWPRIQALMVAGTLPPRIATWLLEHCQDDGRGGDSEVREGYLFYYRILHPEMDPAPSLHIPGQEASGL